MCVRHNGKYVAVYGPIELFGMFAVIVIPGGGEDNGSSDSVCIVILPR